MGNVHVVNMIPNSLSGETNQDSEPSIAVNPANTSQMVATAFTPSPLGGSLAPIYVSTNAGATWSLNSIVPGGGSSVTGLDTGTNDISVAFATTGGMLYAGILRLDNLDMNILRTPTFSAATPMTVLVDRPSEDQPWVVAGSVVVGVTSVDRVFVGNNDKGQPGGQTATVDVSQDAAGAAPPAGFSPVRLERAATSGMDGPPVRLALDDRGGTVYAAFERWNPGSSFPNLNIDVVVTRDDNWGNSTPPFQALIDATGSTVASGRFVQFNAVMGQERLGGDLTIALNQDNPGVVFVGWCDRVGGVSGTDWTLHVSRSIDWGETWSADVRTITNAKNPSLAINTNGMLALVYQAFTGTQWVTTLELTPDAWATAPETHILHRASATTPARTFFPYLGDYIRIVSVGTEFFGVFCGSNTPNMADFPSGVSYQRNANWTTNQLLGIDGVTVVGVSIDPFFFSWSEQIVPRGVGVQPRGVATGPITRGRSPILPSPIGRTPPVGQPPSPTPGPLAPTADPPTDLDL